MIVVYGAGAVGLTLAARLAQAAGDVLLVARRPEVAEHIARHGVEVEHPASGERFRAPVPAVAGIEAAVGRIGDDAVLFCMRRPDLEEAAAALAAVAPDAVVASLQNDVDNEERLAQRFRRVLGVVVRQTCTRVGPGEVVALEPGRYVVGVHPEGDSPQLQRLAEALRSAGYDVGVSRRIAEDKWLKLCVNLMSAPNALIRREDHATRAFVELKARLLEEARSVLAAAGIEARSCDGRDRSLDAEIAWQRESLERGTSARRLPLYNNVWAALRWGGPFEACDYHRRILALAAANDVAAPANRRVLAALERAVGAGRGPECLGAAELLGDASATSDAGP
jgi:2-dehydropantoate 2-reductase